MPNKKDMKVTRRISSGEVMKTLKNGKIKWDGLKKTWKLKQRSRNFLTAP